MERVIIYTHIHLPRLVSSVVTPSLYSCKRWIIHNRIAGIGNEAREMGILKEI